VVTHRIVVVALVGAAVLAGCAATPAKPAAAHAAHVASHSHHVAPRPAAPAKKKKYRLPAFADRVSGPLTRADVPYTWRPGCPVPPQALREIHLTYYGFDHRAHTGRIIVNASVVTKVIKVFRTLYRAKFPIKQMVPVDKFHGSDPRSMAADNTSGFNCRLAVTTGPPTWSMHAYGLAIDVNTVQNPYVETPGDIQPVAGRAYANRSDIRPGMAYPGGVLVNAFYSIGWGWGGNWSGSPDYQHFSSNGH
jgi:hypothetical protein